MLKKKEVSLWIATVAVLILSYIVFYAMALRPGSDVSIHATWASEGDFLNPRTFFNHVAHPLWHGMVAVLLAAGVPLAVSAALVTALLKAAEVWLLIRLSAKLLGRGGWLATVCGLIAGLVMAVWVPWVNPTVYLGAGSPNTWHNPTQIIAIVFMLVCVPMTAHCVEVFQRRLPEQGKKANVDGRYALLLSALLLVSLMAKPTFLQAFVPAACLYFLVLWIRKPHNTAFIGRMMLVAAPAVLMMLRQYIFYFCRGTPGQSIMVLQISWDKAAEVGVYALLTRLFPLFALLACANRDMWRKPLYGLVLLMDVVSILEMLLLGESGARASDGNFGWAMMGSSLMLWAITLPLYLKRVTAWFSRRRAAASGQPYLEDKPRAEAARCIVGGVLLLWHVASGIGYIIYLLTTTATL